MFSLFHNSLSPFADRLCERLVDSMALTHRPPQTSVAKSFRSTDHTDPIPPPRSVPSLCDSCRNGNRTPGLTSGARLWRRYATQEVCAAALRLVSEFEPDPGLTSGAR